MFPAKTLLTISTLLSLPISGAAQFTFNPPSSGLTFTRILPSYESRYGSFDRTMGDAIVGGTVHAYTGMVRQQQGTYEMADLAIELSASGKFLGRSAEVMDISGFGSNVVSNGVQSRSGQFRYEILGSTVSSSFQSNVTIVDFGTFQLFPQDVTGSVSFLGGYRASLTGNATCGYGFDASWSLPAGKAEVGVVANGDTFAIISAAGQIRVGTQTGSITITGKIVNNQALNVNATTSAGSGLSGSATYAMNQTSAVMTAFSLGNSTILWVYPSVSKKLL
jgi:hypothetical protein